MPKTIFEGPHQALVAVLVKARRNAGLKQAELASRIGRDQSHISLIERGQRRVDVVEFVKLAEAMDVAPSDLLREFIERKSD